MSGEACSARIVPDMSYLVLARKYRPTNFGDVAGQDVTTGVLKGAISEGRVGHAYLFSGPRGTGKTTTARIFAKSLICEEGPSPDPCGVCERCLSTDAGSEVDIVEIDAASNTGVDNIRDLRDQAAYAPMRARYKVYIIDEVHMLSKGAFNALLKTLEEPPPHVKFLFATTEKHKVPDTILSRCQVCLLNPISEADIVGRLNVVAGLEGLSPGPGVVEELARRARGGMRDALSLFDQLLALVGSAPVLEDVERLGGESGTREIDEVLGFVETGNRAALMQALTKIDSGEAELVESLLDLVRVTLFVSLCGADHPVLGAVPSEETIARANRVSHDRLQIWLEELLYARGRLRQAQGHERLVIELALLELCREEASMPVAEMERRLLALEARLGDVSARPVATNTAAPAQSQAQVRQAAVPPAPQPSSSTPAAAPPVQSRPTAPAASPAPTPTATDSSPAKPVPTTTREIWFEVLNLLKVKQGALSELLEKRGRLDELTQTSANLHFEMASEGDRRMVTGKRNLSAITRAFKEVIGREVELNFGERVAPPPAKKDEYTQEVADMFGGFVEENK